MKSRRDAPRGQGFTLIELLVVVAIVAVLAGVVSTSFIGSGQNQALEGFAHRMAQRIELARDRALQRNKEWGLYVNDDRYEFAEFNPVTQTWEPYSHRPFNSEAYASKVQMKAQVEAYAGQLGSEEDALPDIIFFSSGEVTPFALTIQPTSNISKMWLLESDGFTRVRAKLPES